MPSNRQSHGGAYVRFSPTCLALTFALAGLAATAALAQQTRFNEREIKAAFLYNFVQFVEWPLDAFAAPGAPVVIGVLGDDPFGRVLDDVINGETVKNRVLTTRRFTRVEEIQTCHVLFISASESRQYEQIFEVLRGRPVLTVGETEGFASRGGMIRFLPERNRIRLRVNVSAAKAAGLTISSNLLRPADIVEGEH